LGKRTLCSKGKLYSPDPHIIEAKAARLLAAQGDAMLPGRYGTIRLARARSLSDFARTAKSEEG